MDRVIRGHPTHILADEDETRNVFGLWETHLLNECADFGLEIGLEGQKGPKQKRFLAGSGTRPRLS